MSTKATNPKDVAGGSRVPMWLLSPIAKAHWAAAQFAGLVKYGAWNWRRAGARKSVYLSAIQRHVDGLLAGEEFDPVDGTRHEGNIMACCAILLETRAAGNLLDDTPPILDHRPALAEVEQLMAKLREQYKDMSPHHHAANDGLPTLTEVDVELGKAPFYGLKA
jgi:hypothetical protein